MLFSRSHCQRVFFALLAVFNTAAGIPADLFFSFHSKTVSSVKGKLAPALIGVPIQKMAVGLVEQLCGLVSHRKIVTLS